jgi:predicted RNase H-like nuclease (RuvC/YqgF family)
MAASEPSTDYPDQPEPESHFEHSQTTQAPPYEPEPERERPEPQYHSVSKHPEGARAETGVRQAIEEVERIIENLKITLDDMDEVLELLELAERQKTLDEQEIESLKRALRQIHRPREGGQPSHRR